MMNPHKPTILFLSTYPPRECGIATFTQDLLYSSQQFLGPDIVCKVAALNLTSLDTHIYPAEVEWEIDENNRKEYFDLANTVNRDPNISGVMLQHEYGIFGGTEGEKILSFMNHCTKPILVTLHTVLPNPNPKMKDVTSKIIKLARTVVVLTQSSKEIIEKIYPATIGKVYIIPHGIHAVTFSDQKTFKAKLDLENHIILSSFGLLSRGKGLEYAINALPQIIEKYPSVIYLILGETHPVVRRQEGEKYRIELSRLVAKLHLQNHVKFYDQYLDLPDLLDFLKATDIYISTSTNPNQAVSGTLSYAMGAGRAVISTEFAQAKEIVSPESGRLVPIKDSPALTLALLDMLGDEKRLKKMHLEAYKKTRPMLWSNVAKKHIDLLVQTTIPDLNMNHLHNMTDKFGLFQFGTLAKPNKSFGYTLDDNARALILCSWLIERRYTKELEKMISLYFSFLKKCQREDGSFINYIDFVDKTPTKQNDIEDLTESQARALWALGEMMSNRNVSLEMRNESKKIFLLALKYELKSPHLRATAQAIKAFALAQGVMPKQKDMLLTKISQYADVLVNSLNTNSLKSWTWFEQHLSYNNALLSESLIIAGNVTKNLTYTQKGLASLQFLIKKTFSDNMYMPIGQSHWYKNHKKRSKYDQQPEEPASMIFALKSAYNNTNDASYKNLAKICFSWFLGNNSLNRSLYDDRTGGCYDGLHHDRVNLNQGAESLVSYLMSNFIARELN